MPPMPSHPRESGAEVVPGNSPALLRALGHEVGNLLAGIRLSAHLLVVGEAGRDAAAEIEELSDRAGALMAHVRPLLQPGSEDQRARLGAAELLEGLTLALEDRHKGSTRLSIEPPAAGLPATRGDSGALHHVLVSLALGALEAKPEGGVRVRARPRGGNLVVAVEDDGEDLSSGSQVPVGRMLDVRIAAAVLERDGGRVVVASTETGNRIELVLTGA